MCSRLIEPVMAIVTSFSGTRRGLATMERVVEPVDTPVAKPGSTGAVAAHRRARRQLGGGQRLSIACAMQVPGEANRGLIGSPGAV